MLTLEKSHGLTKLGWREKSILLLMLKSDNPPGKPNPIWFDIYSEFGLNYTSLPKKYQPKFREERNFRLSIHRLTKKGLVRPVSVIPDGCSLADPRGYGYNFYSLTQTGRAIAEKLGLEKRASKSDEDFDEILKLLKAQGSVIITLGQMRELLWQKSHGKFSDREAFEKYWSQRRLAVTLKKRGLKNVRAGFGKRQRIYFFCNPA